MAIDVLFLLVSRCLGVSVTGGWRCAVFAAGNVAERWGPQLSLSPFILSGGLCPPSWACLMAFRLNWTCVLAAQVAVSHRRDVGTASLGAAWVRLLDPPRWGASLSGVTGWCSASLGPKQGWLCVFEKQAPPECCCVLCLCPPGARGRGGLWPVDLPLLCGWSVVGAAGSPLTPQCVTRASTVGLSEFLT